MTSVTELDKNCRCCYEAITTSSFSLTDEFLDYEMPIYNAFQLISGLTLNEKDLNRATICPDCVKNLLKWYKFRRLIVKTAEMLKNEVFEENLEVLEEDSMQVEWLEDDSLEENDAIETENQVYEPDEVLPNNDGYYECPRDDCVSIFTSIPRLQDHLLLQHPTNTQFNCDKCPASFVLLANLKRHCHKKHTAKPFICDICAKSFALIAHLRGHMRTVHLRKRAKAKKSPCPICGKIFSCVFKLSRHRQAVHFRESIKSISCGVCGISCVSMDVLRKHTVVHSDERPFKCTECQQSFKLKGSLTAHVKAVHIGERNFSCDICGSDFKNKRQLVLHSVTHSEDKPFNCHHCAALFKLKIHRDAHEIRVHSSGKPKRERKQQVVRKNQGNRFQCTLCGVVFYTKKQVVRHAADVHKDSDKVGFKLFEAVC